MRSLKVTFLLLLTDISENGGVVTITASLSNPKMAETSVNIKLEGTSTQLVDYEVSSIFGYKTYAGETNNPGVSVGVGSDARFERPYILLNILRWIQLLCMMRGLIKLKKLTVKE